MAPSGMRSLCLLASCATVAALHVRNSDPAPPKMLHPGILHFMFELKDELQHPGIWGKYWSQALPGTYKAWAHCTDHDACEKDFMMKKLGVRLVSKVYSSRGADLINPFVHMIRIALKETKPMADAGVVEKFILLSDATLPVKSFAYTHWDQTSRPESDICISHPTQWSKLTLDGVHMAMVKHHQWVSINRQDAKALASDWSPVYFTRVWNLTLNKGKFAEHPRRISRTMFPGGAWFTATDEEATYERAFGPLELKSEDDIKTMYELFNSRRCVTWVDWPHNVFPVQQLDPFMVDNASRVLLREEASSLLQVDSGSRRNFYNVTTEVTYPLLKDTQLRFSMGKGVMHPFMIEQIGKVGLEVFRKSQYLFARKFSPCAHLPNYTEVMFES